MIAGLRQYPDMRDSGIPWLGKIPPHWHLRRGKFLFTPVDIRSQTGAEELLTVSSQHGVIPRQSASVTMFKAESYVGHKLCWPGDLVINSLWAWGGGLGVSRLHGIVSTAYGVYRLRPEFADYSAYLHELVRSHSFQWELQVRSKGIWISRLQLTDEAFLGAWLPMPPRAECEAIVRFVDHVNRRIRRVIRAKQKLIALLNEQKQAVIYHAVTRGLDASARLKPSGVDWLGDVPRHWDVRTLRSCVADTRAGLWGSDPTPENASSHITCLRVADFDMRQLRVGTSKLTRRALPEAAQQSRLLEKGDILIEKSGGGDAEPVGRVVIYDLNVPAISSNFVTRIRTDRRIAEPEFLLFVLALLQSTRRNVPFIKQTTGIQNLDETAYFSLRIGVPPLDEQRRIVASINRTSVEIRAALDRAEREIDLLREYRARLIADTVTGKLDVRDIAARLTGEAEEPEPLHEREPLDATEVEASLDIDIENPEPVEA